MRAHLRNREAGQEPLKECALVQASQAPPQLALGCAWRANEQYVLTCKRCKQQEADLQSRPQESGLKIGGHSCKPARSARLHPGMLHCTQACKAVHCEPRHL